MISDVFIQKPLTRAHGKAGRSPIPTADVENYPPNYPPTSALLVLKLKFYTKIFALYSRR